MPLFKDFNKETNDLLTKNYSKPGAWKVESKFKGPKDQLFVNPNASNDGVNVDFQYNLGCCPTKVKINVTPDLKSKATVTYEEKGHKVEFSHNCKFDAYELTYEGNIAGVSVYDKLDKDSVEASAALGVAKNCSVGAAVTYARANGAISWSAGARYAEAGRFVSIVTNALKTYTTGVSSPLKVAFFNGTVGAQVNCMKGGFTGTFGAETQCILFEKNALRVKVDNKLSWAVAYVVKLVDNWKLAVSVDAALKPGLQLTRE
jgi:hypothetical protein